MALTHANYFVLLAIVFGLCEGEQIKAQAAMYYSGAGSGMPQTPVGTIDFVQMRGQPRVTVTGLLTLTEAGAGNRSIGHGFHVHQFGGLGNGCKDAGGHYNPTNSVHGGPMDTRRHVGDLGNVLLTQKGMMVVNINDSVIQLYGEHSIIGRALVIHDGTDDLGKGNFADSETTGHAGGRVACGVIGVVSENYMGSSAWHPKPVLMLLVTLLLLATENY